MSVEEADSPLLDIRGLTVAVPRRSGDWTTLVDGLDLHIDRGEIFGLIGETGAGKSMSAWATIDLLPSPAQVVGGEITFDKVKLDRAKPASIRDVRGSEIGIVMQNPRAAFNPMRTIGKQIATALRSHTKVSRADAKVAVVEALRSVGIADPAARADLYPHEMSGGMAQRAMIAMALINKPKLIIADEPTTGLDATVQAQILELLGKLVEQTGTSIWLITHDLGIVANYAHRAGVMFGGTMVEASSVRTLFTEPRHPYSRELIQTIESDAVSLHPNAGKPPNLVNPTPGCRYAYRCVHAEDRCIAPGPDLYQVGSEHVVRCILAEQPAAHSEAKVP